MKRLGGLFLAIILFTSVGISSTSFISANAESDPNPTEIHKFSSATIVSTSSTTLTNALEFMDDVLVQLSSETDPKVGPAVSQAAQLHKLFAHEDKSIKKQFQKEFLAFIKQVKGIAGVGNGAAEKSNLNELYKSGLKIKMQSDKEDEIEMAKEKSNTGKELSILKKTLRNSMNEYVIIDKTMKNGPEKDKLLSDLKEKNINLMKERMLIESKHNDKKLTLDDIKKINQKATELVKNPKSEKTDSSDNGNNGKGSDKASQSNSDKGKGSDNGKSSDKGNKNKSNKGKSKK